MQTAKIIILIGGGITAAIVAGVLIYKWKTSSIQRQLDKERALTEHATDFADSEEEKKTSLDIALDPFADSIATDSLTPETIMEKLIETAIAINPFLDSIQVIEEKPLLPEWELTNTVIPAFIDNSYYVRDPKYIGLGDVALTPEACLSTLISHMWTVNLQTDINLCINSFTVIRKIELHMMEAWGIFVTDSIESERIREFQIHIYKLMEAALPPPLTIGGASE